MNVRRCLVVKGAVCFARFSIPLTDFIARVHKRISRAACIDLEILRLRWRADLELGKIRGQAIIPR